MPKTRSNVTKRVWRVSPEAPQGAWVDPAESVTPTPKLAVPEVSSGSWVTSSYDLLDGTDVAEFPDGMTPEQIEDLCKPLISRAKGPEK